MKIGFETSPSIRRKPKLPSRKRIGTDVIKALSRAAKATARTVTPTEEMAHELRQLEVARSKGVWAAHRLRARPT